MTITPPGAEVRAQALARFDALAKPLGSLGRLEALGAWLAACQGGCPPQPLQRVTAIVPAGDHGVVSAGVAAHPKEITAAMVRTILAGVAGMSVLAAQHGVPVRVFDIAVDDDLEGVPSEVKQHKVRRSSGSIDTEDAITPVELDSAWQAARAVVSEERAAGTQLLVMGDLGIGNTTPAAALVASILSLPATQVTGRGAGLDDDGLARKATVIQRALDRTAAVGDPTRRLAALGSADLAFGVGVLVEAARAGIPVLLDGVISVAEALVAESIVPGVRDWFAAGHRSPEPAQVLALESLGLTPLVDLGMRLGEGSGAMTALPILRSAVLALRDMALLADLMPPAHAGAAGATAPAAASSGTAAPGPAGPGTAATGTQAADIETAAPR